MCIIDSAADLAASKCHIVVKTNEKIRIIAQAADFGSFQVQSGHQKRLRKCVLLRKLQILQLPSDIWT